MSFSIKRASNELVEKTETLDHACIRAAKLSKQNERVFFRVEDAHASLRAEAYAGVTRWMTTCDGCKGLGRWELTGPMFRTPQEGRCPVCNGSGKIADESYKGVAAK